MENYKGERIWITWEYQIRNRSLSRLLDADLYEILEDQRSALGRYFVCVLRTLSVIREKKPSWIFHQNPSVFLGFFLIMIKPFFQYKIVTDTHNAGLKPAEGRYKLLNAIGRLVSKKTDYLIVHNEIVANEVSKYKTKPFVLPDPLPIFFTRDDVEVDPNKLVFVCRWSADEPYEEVISSFGLLKKQRPELSLYITGKPPIKILERKLTRGIHLTGFLEEKDYQTLLKSSSLMIVLTNRTDSLNCGAYEALSLAKPCILYNTDTLRQFFGESFYYSDLDSYSITDAVLKSLGDRNQIIGRMEERRVNYLADYDAKIKDISSRFNKSLV